MTRYEVTSDRLTVGARGDVVEIDPSVVDIPALLAAGHVKPAATEAQAKKGALGGDVRP